MNVSGSTSVAPHLMPVPFRVKYGGGSLPLGRPRITYCGANDRVARALARFSRVVELQSGSTGTVAPLALTVTCPDGNAMPRHGGTESYQLRIGSGGIQLSAAEPAGVVFGLETILQLIVRREGSWNVPFVQIDDRPRFLWRGLLIDPCRHWMPVNVIRRTVDAMSVVKLNVLHWHLSDDQAFRAECRTFPRLHEVGGGGRYYYTSAEMADVVSYCADRGIRVVPEFDLPGHTSSWLAAYPSLGSSDRVYSVEKRWGIFDAVVDPTRDSTWVFLDAFFEEMCGIFTDEFVHVGGDEVTGREWVRSPDISAFMAEHNFSTPRELQQYFAVRLALILSKYGRRVVSWEEVSSAAEAGGIVETYRGEEAVIAATAAGQSCVVSAPYYLDHARPAAFHYAADPVPLSFRDDDPVRSSLVVGGEACMWSEFVTEENVDSRIWPRAAAIAERLWSAMDVVDVESMYDRLSTLSGALERRQLTHRSGPARMLEGIAGDIPLAWLQTLASAVEPVKDYARSEWRTYDADTPLDRFVDIVPPESEHARRFAKAVGEFCAGARPDSRLLSQLDEWAANHKRLCPFLQRSEKFAELVPLSAALEAAAMIGGTAARALAAGSPPRPEDVGDWHEQLRRAAEPHAELLVAIVESMRQLVTTATASR